MENPLHNIFSTKLERCEQMQKMRFVILLAVLAITFSSYGQHNAKTGKAKTTEIQSNKLIGTWRIIEYSDLNPVTGKC